MAILDRGPLELPDPATIAPFPARESFQAIAARVLGPIAGADPRLSAAQSTVASANPNPSDGFDNELGAAADGATSPPGADVNSDVSASVERGNNADTLRTSVQDTLPPVDTNIDMQFDSPPPLTSEARDPDAPYATKEDVDHIEALL